MSVSFSKDDIIAIAKLDPAVLKLFTQMTDVISELAKRVKELEKKNATIP